uniref:Uncharacterized protein n=1 Tax=Rhizophora mucronata TaxID=61149 RepID=A0A2P2NZ46_RHIMU
MCQGKIQANEVTWEPMFYCMLMTCVP